MQRIICRKCLLLSFVALIALLCGYWAYMVTLPPELELNELQAKLKQATVLPVNFRQVPEFEMQNQRGETVGRELFIDRWSLMFFGYTSCPDACPISMSVLKQASLLITQSPDSPIPQVVFVSVDPLRDTAERLQSYIAYFNDSFIGLSGSEAETQNLTRTLGIVYKIDENADLNANYLVDHSASFLLINPAGGLQAILSAPHDPGIVASDYQKIVRAIE
jgi:protein SCO1/2